LGDHIFDLLKLVRVDDASNVKDEKGEMVDDIRSLLRRRKVADREMIKIVDVEAIVGRW
jgi:hypothetical protein